MKAILYFSNVQTVYVNGLRSLEHGEQVAHVIASRLSAINNETITAEMVKIDSNNFICMTGEDAIMQGVGIQSPLKRK